MGYIFLVSCLVTGAVFAVSVVSKVRSRSAFRAFTVWLAGLPVPGKHGSRPVATGIAGIEAAIIVLICVPGTARLGLALAAGVLAVFAGGTRLAVSRGVRAPCRCFGQSTVPLGGAHVVRNVLLCAVAASGAATGGGAVRAAGIALSAGIAATIALLAVFSDDLAAVLSQAGPDPAAGSRPQSAQQQVTYR